MKIPTQLACRKVQHQRETPCAESRREMSMHEMQTAARRVGFIHVSEALEQLLSDLDRVWRSHDR